MNCSNCRYELSQCLDGRLPSGRRTVVLQHAESCSACGAFWAELQAAQQLTLHLQQPRVSPGFRDQLWERIRAGEGTPEAVFHEPVPLMAKLRYALTGAAAAAALLAAAMWISRDQRPAGEPLGPREPLAQQSPSNGQSGPIGPIGAQGTGTSGNGTSGTVLANAAPGALVDNPRSGQPRDFVDLPFDPNPLFATTERLTFDLVAVEAAKQLDQRYASATMALRRLDQKPADDGPVVEDVFESVDEFQAFGELLLDLHDRERLYFRDLQVGADLRVAIDMLGQSRQSPRNHQTVRALVVPALRSSRLASVSRTISLVPTLDPREERDVLVRLNTQRPDVFQQLFVVVGQEFGGDMPSGGAVFLLHGDCGPTWVARRSAIEAHEGRLRLTGRR
jgi:hypothetical protein